MRIETRRGAKGPMRGFGAVTDWFSRREGERKSSFPLQCQLVLSGTRIPRLQITYQIVTK